MNCTAVLVTRGDVDLLPVLRSIPDSLPGSIWNNAEKPRDEGPYGQFVEGQAATTKLVYFQDDDCVTEPAAIIAQWEPGKIVCNIPDAHWAHYRDAPDVLMGFGSCFEQSLILETFLRYVEHFPMDEVLKREPGRIFTALNRQRIKRVNVPVTNLPWADAPNRLYRQQDHIAMRDEVRRRCAVVLEREGVNDRSLGVALVR